MIQLQVEVCDGVRVSCAAVKLVSDPDINVCISTVQYYIIFSISFNKSELCLLSVVSYPKCSVKV